MKIAYFNDEGVTVRIRRIGPAPDFVNTYVDLLPGDLGVYDIGPTPQGAIAYVKHWPSQDTDMPSVVLLSYMVPSDRNG